MLNKKPSPILYFSYNRFVYDYFVGTDNPNYDDLSNYLLIPKGQINYNFKKYIKHWFPRNCNIILKDIKNIVSSLNIDELLEPPIAYRLYHESIQKNILYTVQQVELIIESYENLPPFHFDSHMLLQSRLIPNIPIEAMRDFFSCNKRFNSNVLQTVKFEKYDYLTQCYNSLPDCIKCLTGDERLILNNELSIAYLYGVIDYPRAYISSPHLHGVFNLSSRRANTGYLSLDSIINSKNNIPIDKFNDILNWLKDNNPLYRDFEPLTKENYEFRIDPERAPSGNAVNSVMLLNNCQNSTDSHNNVYIRLKTNNNNVDGKFIPLEEALALSFLLLFPFGVLKKIPGKTLREKSKSILGAHPYYRCGRLQCHLILFLYHLIIDHDTSYFHNKISMQMLNLPHGASRNVPPEKFRSDDPAFATYWSRRQAEVRTMCSQFGDPDIMLTLTFVNKWPEVQKIEKEINDLNYDKIGIRFCPLEEMYIWNQRFNDIKRFGFKILIKSLGFGEVNHYTWRLEFQARGAPHAHILIWLNTRLSIDTINKYIYAIMPNESTPKLRNLVNGPMLHTCDINRCKKGIPTAKCKYGFPKPECGSTYVNDDGEIIIKRNVNESNIVEYHPYLLLKWEGHCHMHILRTKEHPECSPNAIFYIVKYNFKSEPSLRIQMKDESSNFRTAFHGRVVSAEEAISRIFSFDYYGSDTSSEYLSIKPPETRKAAFINEKQIQITNIDKYFARPLELERMGILTFFSIYNINPSYLTNAQRITYLRNNLFGEQLRNALEKPSRIREPNTLVNNWEENNFQPITYIRDGWLFPSSNLPDAKALKISLKKPKIIITEKFNSNSNIEEFAYAYLLLSGLWRSDDEMKAGKNTWVEALEYHGLCLPDDDDIMKFNKLLIKYMLNSSRYSEFDISRTISMMNEDMTRYLEALKSSVSNEQKILIDKINILLKSRDQLLNNQIESLESEPNPEIIRKYIYCSFDENQRNNANIELNSFINAFNKDQSALFNEIKDRIDAGIQINAFISGKAGTGKTFLINALKLLFISKNIPFIVCASTGIAASLIGGRTVHSAFGIFVNKKDNYEEAFCSLDISKENGYSISFAKVIIIDEVTMLPGKVLLALNDGLKKLSAQKNDINYTLPFGGRNILLFGDLAQVPAVTRAPDDYLESIGQFYNTNVFNGFTRFSLNLVMRQNPEEQTFINLLEYVRNNMHDKITDINLLNQLKQRFIPGTLDSVIDQVDNFVGKDSQDGMVITFTNRLSNEYNYFILSKRQNGDKSKIIDIKAKFFIDQKSSYLTSINLNQHNHDLQEQQAVARIHQASLEEIKIFCGAMKKGTINTTIPFNLHVAPNCRIMLLQNLDLSIGLINGTRGTLIDYIPDIDALKIKFDIQKENEEPILITRKKSIEYQIHNGKTIFMYQFPVKLAWAVTAHKSQGQTLNKVAINISEAAFAHGSLYVALSRVRSLNNIILFGLDKWPENGPTFHMNPYIQYEQNVHAENDF